MKNVFDNQMNSLFCVQNSKNTQTSPEPLGQFQLILWSFKGRLCIIAKIHRQLFGVFSRITCHDQFKQTWHKTSSCVKRRVMWNYIWIMVTFWINLNQSARILACLLLGTVAQVSDAVFDLLFGGSAPCSRKLSYWTYCNCILVACWSFLFSCILTLAISFDIYKRDNFGGR